MKRIPLILSALFAFHYANAQTPLDPTFGNNGISLIDSVDAFYGVDIALQSDKKILALVNGNCGHGFLMRLTPDGFLDSTFQPSASYRTYPVYHKGVLEIQASACNINMSVVRELESKKILMAFAPYGIMQLNADGSTDETFGNMGFSMISNSNDPNAIKNIMDLKEISGGVLFAGSAFPPNTNDTLFLAKMKYDGSMDNTFGTNGYLHIPLPTAIAATTVTQAIKILPDNRILVTGIASTMNSGNYSDIFLAMYNMSGQLDASFGNNGIKVIDFNHNYEYVFHLTYSDNNNIYLLGSSGDNRIIMKMNSEGVIDNTFGTNGVVSWPHISFNGNQIFNGVATSDNHITMGCDTGSAKLYNYLSFNSAGAANTDFTSDGLYFSPNNDNIAKMIAQPDNKVLVLGTDMVHPRLMRFIQNKATTPTAIPSLQAANSDIKMWSYQQDYYLTFNENRKDFKVVLYSIDGKIIRTYTQKDAENIGGNSFHLKLPDSLSKGLYILKAESGNLKGYLKAVL